MSLAEQLYRLQQIDLEIERRQKELIEIEDRLSDDKALVAIESKLAAQKEQLEESTKKQKDSEWELEDLQEKVRQIDSKLYVSTNTNPKELVNLEKEVKSLKSQIRLKEDALLELMSQVEEMEANVRTATEEIERLKKEWEQRQATLGQKKSEVETAIAELSVGRNRLEQQIDPEANSIYERLRLTSGQAVVKVERGKCQGCHITVPTSQWQKAKAGDLIQCTSCNKILYLE